MSEKIVVIDLEDAGKIFLNKICQVIDQREINNQQVFVENLRASYPINVMNNFDFDSLCYRRFIYEVYYLFNQELSAIICQDYQLFLNRLKTVPDINYYRHIRSFQDEHNIILITNAFKEYCMMIYSLITRYVNPENIPCEYLITSVTDTYMVVSKYLRININI